MIRLGLAVNDANGDVTDTCQRIDVEIDQETVMQFEGEVSFLEIPDNVIQIGNVTLSYDFRGTMVGNVFWNCYDVFAEDVVLLLNELMDQVDLTEAVQPLWEKWHSGDRFTMDDFNALAA
jgi:hypothetical protein